MAAAKPLLTQPLLFSAVGRAKPLQLPGYRGSDIVPSGVEGVTAAALTGCEFLWWPTFSQGTMAT